MSKKASAILFIIIIVGLPLLAMFKVNDINTVNYTIETIDRYINNTQAINIRTYNGFRLVDMEADESKDHITLTIQLKRLVFP